ncbi:hypothetical protein AALP_AA4G072000 [Arabis alpina]|uniref:RRM domain-containing protein n=1 Tax=Arabis alpina TaxID=50452 RepID=A0A087H1Q4_ARAAL|nr:hypothetical protein AALP_AA4G072000 [Arabis alpina]
MGKSSKKSASKVESAPALVKDSKPLKKGKREPEDDLETKVNLKKQKVAAVPAKKLPKKVESSDSDSSDSEEEVKAKKVPAKKVVAKVASSSDDSEDSSSDDEPAQKKAATNGAVVKKSKDESSSDDDSSDEEVAVAKKPAAAAKNGSVKAKAESSSEEEDSSSEDEEPAKKPVAAKAAAKVESSSEEESDDDSEDEKPAAKKAAPAKAASSSSDEDSDEESEDEKPAAKKAKADIKASKKESSSDESSEESEEESEDEKATPKKKSSDVEMVDADVSNAKPKTPSTPAAGGPKTLFAGNLSFSIERSDVEEFFKGVAEVVDVRFATSREDGSFRGFGHIEFASSEDATKAFNLNGKPLLGRDIRLDMANERGERPAYTPQSNARSGGGGFDEKPTVFVKGFDSSLAEDDIKNALGEHFASCGEITRVSVPIDRETGASKGIAYIDFSQVSEKEKAFELDGSDLGGYSLKVDEPRPKADNSGGFGGGRSSGGRFGGGRDSGGRRGRGRGGDRGRGRGGDRGRGRSSFVPQGKRTTFD